MRVGLTGGVASGKSTVAAMLAELGCVVIDADVIAREVVEPGTPGFDEVVAAFGSDVVGPDGALDRPALGAIVFNDPDKRRTLEGIVHPRVFERYAELEGATGPDDVVVHDIPLLAEAGRADSFDAVIVVEGPDRDTVIESVTKTGRCVIVHEAPKTSGFGAELSALVQERCFHHLEAPIARVTGWDTPYPHAFEWEYFPGPQRVADALKVTMSGGR